MYNTAACAYQFSRATESIAIRAKPTYKFSTDIRFMLMSFKDSDKTRWKTAIPSTQDRWEKVLFTEKVKEYMPRKCIHKNNCCNLFYIVIKQCRDMMKTNI